MLLVKKDIEVAKKRLFETLRRDIDDERVLHVMEAVPRESFIPLDKRHLAYENIPLPIGEGQMISQPYVVAMMTSALNLQPTDKVMELGTGCGYQAAILSLLIPDGKIVTLERIPRLANSAQDLLRRLKYSNVDVRISDRSLGCPEEAPFDAIIVTAAAPAVPNVLLNQLRVGGRMVIPTGTIEEQELVFLYNGDQGTMLTSFGVCRFVPLIGEGAWDQG